MEDYRWTTEESMATNTDTMNNYIENEMDESWVLIFEDGSYCEVVTGDGQELELHASGDGDFNNHRIRFERIKR